MPNDWFRKTSWSREDEVDFFVRLKRARANSRPQYIRIQALTLFEASDEFDKIVISLLDIVLKEYPDDIQIASVLNQKGVCLERNGLPLQAVEYYRKSIMQMRKRLSWQTWAWLDLTWLVARQKITQYYDEALSLIEEFGEKGTLFPSVVFKTEASRALILAGLGKIEMARQAARTSILAAEERVLGLAQHPNVGFVTSILDELYARLLALSTGLV